MVLLFVLTQPHKLPHHLTVVLALLQELLYVLVQFVDELLLLLLVALNAFIGKNHIEVVERDVDNLSPRS